MINTVRGRLTLWYVTALALALAIFGAAFYVLLSRALYARVDNGLGSLIEVGARSLSNDLEEGQSIISAALSTSAELATPEQSLLIFDPSGRLLAENHPKDDFQMRLPELSSIPEENASLYTVTDLGGDRAADYRVAARKVTIPPKNVTYVLLASQSLDAVEDDLALLRKPLLFAASVALLLAGLGGWLLARKSLAPVVAMAGSARRIGAENLNQQLPIANPRDELGQLGATFNELLARLRTSFELQRRFMADASHELRTPLSIMRTAASVTLRKPSREADEYIEAIQMMDEQSRRLSRIVKDMFVLSRADSGHYPLDKSSFYLNDLLEEVARAGCLLAEHKNVTIDIANSTEAGFHGDEDLLRRMIMNLVDNAIKYTPAGGMVRLGLTRESDNYMISVSDTGPGIPLES
ncbi:MAG TPA: histidine kinase dimerization/phospho-acceptor domain-containing protein, partial [Blastocatellia bacterium]